MENIQGNDRLELLGSIIDIFEDFLEGKGVEIDNDEKEGDADAAILYGTDYGNLESAIEQTLINWNLISERTK